MIQLQLAARISIQIFLTHSLKKKKLRNRRFDSIREVWVENVLKIQSVLGVSGPTSYPLSNDFIPSTHHSLTNGHPFLIVAACFCHRENIDVICMRCSPFYLNSSLFGFMQAACLSFVHLDDCFIVLWMFRFTSFVCFYFCRSCACRFLYK